MSVDPIGFRSGDKHLYQYARNNPLLYPDPYGLAPGEKYATPNAAAFAASHDIYGLTTENGVEYGGYIIDNGDNTYTYTVPVKGTVDRLDLPPKPSNVFASYHSHPSVNDGQHGFQNTFSELDRWNSHTNKFPVYLVDPTGNVSRYSDRIITPLYLPEALPPIGNITCP